MRGSFPLIRFSIGRHFLTSRLSTIIVCAFAAVGLNVSSSFAQGLPAEENEIVKRTNDFRKTQGLGSVPVDPILAATARSFACYMAGTGRYGHEADGNTPTERAQQSGWPSNGCVKENIAMNTGRTSGEQGEALTRGWINSPGHRANMLTVGAKYTGVGVCASQTGAHYGVQLFGRKEWARLTMVNTSSKRLNYSYTYGKNKTRTGSIDGVSGGSRSATVGTCGFVKVTVTNGVATKSGITSDNGTVINF